MKNLVIALITLFASSTYAQQSVITEANKLVTEFNTSQKPELIAEAKSLIDKAFESSDFKKTTKAYVTKAKVEGLSLFSNEQDDTISSTNQVLQTYTEAYEKDTNAKYRYDLSISIFPVKAKLVELGSKAYSKSDYKKGYAYYNLATEINDLEIAYPQVTPLDTSVVFTAGMLAKLGGMNKEAITKLQQVIDLDYDRKDAYGYLIDAYREEGMEAKAKNIEALKAQRYPE